MPITAGQLRERVIVLKQSTVANTQGGRTVTWVDLVTGSATALTQFWASIHPWATQQDETRGASAITAHARYRVTMRYRADVTTQMQLRWTRYKATSATTLEIHGVSPSPDRASILLDCVEATT
jgi:head-tail adaptor